ncbi:MAG: RNA-binding S4 domain-containing protein [Clostridiaceae bacterium]|jgi:ribosomal 50S subunit-recycling heat shock protein|nr:RNA-binding S4 domain-containing protein [Clostridiaceae bacterium]
MRIDKFLKVSRVIKRRTVAQEACDAGRITINGKPAKPAKEVKQGDKVTVTFGTREINFTVLSVEPPKNQKDIESMYSVDQSPE